MTLIPLTGGAYTAQSIIASAQRCVNLYTENNPKDAPVPTTHYLTPGLTSIGFTTANGLPIRWQYEASNGNVYTVAGSISGSVLYVSVPVSSTSGIGNTSLVCYFSSLGTTPVSMSDNGLVLVIVDGTKTGWAVDLSSKTGVSTGTITPGVGYTNGTYNNITLTGGSGTGATASIIVAGGVITSVVPYGTNGSGYLVGDQLSATLPGVGAGFLFTLTSVQNSFAIISDPNFLGASKVDILDTFFLFNVPGTNEWYIGLSEANFQMFTGVTGTIQSGSISAAGSSYSNGLYNNVALLGGSGTGATANIIVAGNIVTSVTIATPGLSYIVGDQLTATFGAGGTGFQYTVDTIGGTAFDTLDVATKITYPDPIVALIVMHAEIWLIGAQTTEVWYNAGAADFTFQILPGVFIEHGCAAPYSVCKQDLSIYWVSQDKQGQAIIVKGNGYAVHRISTFAIENELSKYSTISDAIGFTYQQMGHTFAVFIFPTADKTWVWDEATGLWHERASLQYASAGAFLTDGNLHKVLYKSAAVCGGKVYVGDYLGNIWYLDPKNYTENGFEISRIRSWPHLLDGQKRVSYKQFIADMEVGTDDSTITNDGTSSTNPPVVNLRWSDNRGKSYGNYVQRSLGALGKYLTSIQWRRLGQARDRVFEISWSVNTKTALNGAWIEVEPAGS